MYEVDPGFTVNPVVEYFVRFVTLIKLIDWAI